MVRIVYTVLYVIIIVHINVITMDAKVVTGANFMKINTGTRSSAMGKISSDSDGDIESIDINIGGLSRLNRLQIFLGHSELYQDIRYESLLFGLPLSTMIRDGNGVIGVNFKYLYSGGFEGYNDWGEVIHNVSYGVYDIGIGYSIDLINRNNFYMSSGILFSYFKENIYKNIYYYLTSDIGTFISFALKSREIINYIGKEIKIDLVVKNISLKKEYNAIKLPTLVQLSSGIKLFQKVNLRFGVSFDFYKNILFGIGTEYWLKNIIAFRGGIKFGNNTINMLSFGVGFKYRMLGVDYAILPYNDLGMVHKFGLKIEFGKKEIDKKALSDMYYYKGINKFIKNDMIGALKMWQKALEIYPGHTLSRKRILEVEKLLKFEKRQKRIDKKFLRNLSE